MRIQNQPLEEQHQLTADTDKIAIGLNNNAIPISDSNILHLKCFRSFKYVQERLNELISKFGYYGQVCFKVSLDKKNGKVISFEIEGQNQKDVAEKNGKKDTPTTFTAYKQENGQNSF